MRSLLSHLSKTNQQFPRRVFYTIPKCRPKKYNDVGCKLWAGIESKITRKTNKCTDSGQVNAVRQSTVPSPKHYPMNILLIYGVIWSSCQENFKCWPCFYPYKMIVHKFEEFVGCFVIGKCLCKHCATHKWRSSLSLIWLR